MVPPITFHYSLGGAEIPVIPGSYLWASPLPASRCHFQASAASSIACSGFTHGDYFTAARRFLEQEQFRLLSTVFKPERTNLISDIQICLMKHGAFYHPARIRVTSHGRYRLFVLNVAVSDPGHRIIDDEISTLERLGDLPAPRFVPRVFGKGSETINGILTADMFLGEWFEGYHEFHLSRSPLDGTQVLCVWGENDMPYYLAPEEEYLLYHQAAKILTRYFNPVTTEHISHWHHASGDFVIKRELNRLAVKLITVRKYSPLLRMERAAPDPGRISDQAMAGLLLFLLTLSIRMRLDRLDGIGDVAWAGDTAVMGVWTGFLEGLSESCFPIVPDTVTQFENYLSTYSIDDLRDLIETLVASLPIDSAEKRVAEASIGHHIRVLCETISRIGFP